MKECCYFSPVRSVKYCDTYMCLFVCLSVRLHNSKITRWNIMIFLSMDRGLDILWRRCDMLYTSGFVDVFTWSTAYSCLFLGGHRVGKALQPRFCTKLCKRYDDFSIFKLVAILDFKGFKFQRLVSCRANVRHRAKFGCRDGDF